MTDVGAGAEPAAVASFWDSNTIRGTELNSYYKKIVDFQVSPLLQGKTLKVLDLGCGNGLLSIYLACKYGFDVTGVDISRAAVEFAQESAQRYSDVQLSFVNADVLDDLLDFPKFDIVLGHAVLHEFVDQDFVRLTRFLKEHLRAGGYCSFLENNYFNPLFRWVRRGLPSSLRVSHAHEYPFDAQRYAILKEFFQSVRRDCPAVNLADRFYWQLWPRRARRDTLARLATQTDQFLTTVLPSEARTWMSYMQVVSFSQAPIEERLNYAVIKKPWYPVYRV